MIATPAIDLREGRCVQLVGGEPGQERVSLPNPVAVGRGWHELGFASLHVVDLDAALGVGDNLAVIKELVRETTADTQVGGGVRRDERVTAILDAGVDRVVVGTRALDEPDWLEGLARRHPGRITLALDSRGGRILRKGWTEATGLHLIDFLPELAGLPLAGVLSTDVAREGRLEGIDRAWCERIIDTSPHPVWISGGVTTISELEFLDEIGAHGVVLGMAIYTDTLNRREVATRWGGASDGDE